MSGSDFTLSNQDGIVTGINITRASEIRTENFSVMQLVDPPAIEVRNTSQEPILTLTSDGKLHIDPVNTEEAAQVFVTQVETLARICSEKYAFQKLADKLGHEALSNHNRLMTAVESYINRSISPETAGEKYNELIEAFNLNKKWNDDVC